MAFIGFSSRRTEREEAVVEQNHARRLRMSLLWPEIAHASGQVEAGHHVRDDDNVLAIDFPSIRFTC